MIYISPEQVTVKHVLMLQDSVSLAPEHERPDLKELAVRIKAGSAILFEVPSGVILTEVLAVGEERRLNILGFYCPKFWAHCRGITRDLRRLAKDWDCTTIQTVAYSERLAELILLLGARIESISLLLDVEAGHGQQEKEHDDDERDQDGRASDLDASGPDLSGGTGDERVGEPAGLGHVLSGSARSAA